MGEAEKIIARTLSDKYTNRDQSAYRASQQHRVIRGSFPVI